jgi:methylmalonyl-CoA mutase N-terminal domain/subunit
MGLTDVADPLGGSYYVESLTKQLEVEIRKYLEKIDRLGGFVAAVDDLCQELDSQALKVQQEVTRGKRVIVGVNQFSSEQETTPEVFRYDSATPIRAQGRIEALRQQRDGARVKASLDALWKALQDGAPVMLPLVEAARAYATLGEMVAVLRETLGEYAGQGL